MMRPAMAAMGLSSQWWTKATTNKLDHLQRTSAGFILGRWAHGKAAAPAEAVAQSQRKKLFRYFRTGQDAWTEKQTQARQSLTNRELFSRCWRLDVMTCVTAAPGP